MKSIVIYWSMTGNTEMMANAIAEGAKADLFQVSDVNPDDLNNYDVIFLGCPAMGADELEDGEFAPFYESVTDILINKKVALFGSYEWNEGGPWMDTWISDATSKGITVVDSLRVYSTPNDEDLANCVAFGSNLVK